jgi:hypothetical protein
VPAKPLTAEERAEALDTISKGGGCPCCGGIHTAADFGCPRLSWFRRDADGMLIEGSFWPDGSWDASKILFADDDAEAGDGSHPG